MRDHMVVCCSLLLHKRLAWACLWVVRMCNARKCETQGQGDVLAPRGGGWGVEIRDFPQFIEFFRNVPQFSAILLQISRNFSQLDLTLLDRNPPSRLLVSDHPVRPSGTAAHPHCTPFGHTTAWKGALLDLCALISEGCGLRTRCRSSVPRLPDPPPPKSTSRISYPQKTLPPAAQNQIQNLNVPCSQQKDSTDNIAGTQGLQHRRHPKLVPTPKISTPPYLVPPRPY